MQFTVVEGVFDWLGKERKEKAEARKAVLERMAGRADAGAAGAAEKTVLQAEGAKKKGKGRRKPRTEIEGSDLDR